MTINWNWTDSVGSNGFPASGIDSANCVLTSTIISEGSNGASAQCADLAGNIGSGAVRVNIDKTAPETNFILTPPATNPSGNASFTFSGSDAPSGLSGFECQFDAGGFIACSSPAKLTGLSVGI